MAELQQAAEAKSAAAAERDQLAAEREQLLPQLEQARWQNRQLEKKLEEVTAGKNQAEEVSFRRTSHPADFWTVRSLVRAQTVRCSDLLDDGSQLQKRLRTLLGVLRLFNCLLVHSIVWCAGHSSGPAGSRGGRVHS